MCKTGRGGGGGGSERPHAMPLTCFLTVSVRGVGTTRMGARLGRGRGRSGMARTPAHRNLFSLAKAGARAPARWGRGLAWGIELGR